LIDRRTTRAKCEDCGRTIPHVGQQLLLPLTDVKSDDANLCQQCAARRIECRDQRPDPKTPNSSSESQSESPIPESNPEIDLLVAQYESGKSIRSIAKEANLTYSRVRSMIQSSGIQLRSRGRPLTSTPPPPDLHTTSIMTLSKRHDVPPRTISRWRRRWPKSD